MRRVCREATRALGADSAVFYTVDDAKEVSLPAAGYHVPKALLDQSRPMRRKELPASLVASHHTREILFVPDVAVDADFQRSAFKGLAVRSILASPVFTKDRVFGTVLLFWWRTTRDIADADLTLMTALSRQAALALDNGRLLAETTAQAAALRDKNRELDSFVYTASHDLKAPLVTIQGMAGLVLDELGPTLPPDGRHYLERISASTRQMERLIQDLLALSRIGHEARPAEDVHLGELLDEIVADFGETLRAKNIKVTVRDLPIVFAIRVQMEQIFRNLVSNAIKYMGDAAAPEIEIGTIDRGAEVECWVRDTGIGIPAEYHEKVFEIFQRLKDVDVEGSGVGLPIVKKIIEAAGGRIWVESERGQGATFRFTWPGGAMKKGRRSSVAEPVPTT
jgi:signal transduction histidine kinase